MTDEKYYDSTEAFEQALSEAKEQRYVLRLYVAGMTPRSRVAIANIKKICEEQLKGRYDLEVIDIYQQPELAQDEQIIAVPTLIKKLPLPLRRVIGDLSDQDRLIVGLNLQPSGEAQPKEAEEELRGGDSP